MDYNFSEKNTVTATDIIALCVKRNWYDIGSNRDYENMINKLTKKNNVNSDDVFDAAIDIMRHSDISEYYDEESFLQACMYDIWKYVVKKTFSVERDKKCIYEMEKETPLGKLVAYKTTDPKHPGIGIDIKRNGYSSSAPVALIEFTDDDCNSPKDGCISVKVFGDAADKYGCLTDSIIIKNLDQLPTTEVMGL